MNYIVCQNFKSTYPLVNKTRRRKLLIFLSSVNYNFLFLFKMLNISSMSIFTKFFYSYYSTIVMHYNLNNAWYFYKNILSSRNGMLTNNLSLSYNYWVVKYTNTFFKKKMLYNNNRVETTLNYTLPVKVLSFFVKKKTLNKLIVNILLMYLDPAYNYINYLSLTSGFIFAKNIFNNFMFINYFYFKINNY